MYRPVTAVIALLAVTLLPAAYRFERSTLSPSDFDALAERLNSVDLRPEKWQSGHDDFELSEFARQKLVVRHHRSIQLAAPDGRPVHVLIILAETGEIMFHTPEVCYAAHGCEIKGDTEVLELPDANQTARAVTVGIRDIVGETEKTAAYAYWVDRGWTSPATRTTRFVIGGEPYLLKVQLMADGAGADDEDVGALMSDYLTFLGEELAAAGL